MKLSFALACSLAATLPVLATTTVATLDVVDEMGFNEITLTFTPPLLPEGSATTELSGTVGVQLDIDPVSNLVSEMTILNGAVAGTPVTLAGIDPFLGNYNLQSSALGAILETPAPPGLVDPPTGEFDAAQHTFTVNSGTLAGNISIPLFGINETINFDFAIAPVGGAGSGTGSVTLVSTGSTATSQSYEATVLLPISVVENFEVAGPTGPILIPITAIGTAKLVGPATIDVTPPNPYVTWTEDNSIPAAPFDGDENGDGVPNGLLWALGLSATDSPYPSLLQPVGDTGATVDFTVTLPAGGSAGDITVLSSADPESTPFTAVDPSVVSAGNPIPAGTAGTVTISLPKGSTDYVRLQATMP